MVIHWQEGELESIKLEIEEAREKRQLIACQGSIVLRNAKTLLNASLADRKEFSKLIGLKGLAEMNRILAIVRYNG